MNKIDGRTRTVQELLANAKYTLDYYQREYNWQLKQVRELIEDLTAKFFGSYQEGDERKEVDEYGHYFLGSIVICAKEGQRFIIDGQQRLTTLTLLLLILHQLLKDEDQKGLVAPLIFSLRYGTRSFNLNIPERESIMEALYSGEPIDPFETEDQPESIRNIAARYNDLGNLLENHFENQEDALPYFVDWLLDKVCLVEITASTDEDAYTIFETMNDRGLSLTPTDMLKGYLLSQITDDTSRQNARDIWEQQIQTLQTIGKDEGSEAIKAWLRSQYGNTADDFKAIGAEFHRWVRDGESAPNLKSGDDFANFIQRDFAFYSRWYHQLQGAAKTLKPGLECVHYNAQNNFTLQYPVLLAPLCVDDTDEEVLTKIGIGATYLDILIHRRIWNSQEIAQRTMVHLMCQVIPVIRGKSSSEISGILSGALQGSPTFVENSLFQLYGGNRRKIRLILARITDYVEVQSGRTSRYSEYVKTGSNGYEVEHIWANHPQRHLYELSHSEFEGYRNRIGGLLLLPKKSNASYSDLPYAEKRNHYLKENLLAQSLHEGAYERNPGFLQFIEKSGLPFQEYPEFRKAELDKRQWLYIQLAERIWSPERLGTPAGRNSWTIEEIKALVSPELRDYYQTHYPSHVAKFYDLVTQLLNLTHEEGWELSPKFTRRYCNFRGKKSPALTFGVHFIDFPRFVVWMITQAEAEDLGEFCEFEHYSESHRRAVYPKETTAAQLRPIFEFAYRKTREA